MSADAVSRRRFLGQAFAATALAWGSTRARANAPSETAASPVPADAAPGKSLPPILGFSKPFQHLAPEACADLTAEIGWDGLEIPVRARDAITPASVGEKLPALVAALKARGCGTVTVATDIRDIDQPLADSTLRTVASLGIKHVRLGFWKYDAQRHPLAQLAELAPRARDLAQACGALGLQAGIENHSGPTYVGAPVWDLHELIRDLPQPQIGACFDIAHATIEGGLSWSLHARLLASRLSTVIAKDFFWEKTGGAWKPRWCPLGEGMVNPRYFTDLITGGFRGPVIQHHEYELPGLPAMRGPLAHDLLALRRMLGTP